MNSLIAGDLPEDLAIEAMRDLGLEINEDEATKFAAAFHGDFFDDRNGFDPAWTPCAPKMPVPLNCATGPS